MGIHTLVVLWAVPGNYNKANAAVKPATQIFWFVSACEIYVHTVL